MPSGRVLERSRAAARLILLCLLLVNLAGFLFQPMNDSDFFWHLRTGEWILQHRALPQEYLFSVAPPQTTAAAQRFIMTSYWLTQVMLAALHGAGGFAAIVAWRWLLFVPFLVLVARRAQGDPLVRTAFLSLAVLVLGLFPAERPQFVSFLGTAALLYLLDGLRAPRPAAGRRWLAGAVPALMVLWANCHGGFVVGLGLLGWFALAESLKLLHPRLEPLPTGQLRLLLVAIGSGALASLLNPNGWQVIQVALHPGATFIAEYRSTLESYRNAADPWIIVYWGLLMLAAAGLALSWRRPDVTTIGLVALTGYFSFTTLRHVPFFVAAALPPAVAAFSDSRLVRWSRPLLAALGLGAGLFFLPAAAAQVRETRQWARVDAYYFPQGAAAFIEQTGLKGSLFNLYDWGGYLLWRLAPRSVFVDGRGADPELMDEYRRVLAGDRRLVDGQEAWKRTLDRHQLNLAVTPFFHPDSGKLLGIVDALLADPTWWPVYVSATSLVFARDVEANRDVLRRFAQSKQEFYPRLLEFTRVLNVARPDLVAPFVARGDLFQRLGDRASALRSYQQALRLVPTQPLATARIAQLRAAESLRTPR